MKKYKTLETIGIKMVLNTLPLWFLKRVICIPKQLGNHWGIGHGMISSLDYIHPTSPKTAGLLFCADVGELFCFHRWSMIRNTSATTAWGSLTVHFCQKWKQNDGLNVLLWDDFPTKRHHLYIPKHPTTAFPLGSQSMKICSLVMRPVQGGICHCPCERSHGYFREVSCHSWRK